METLLASLTAAGTELSPETETLIRQYRSESHTLHGKQLHHLVARQTQARRELSKVSSEKAAFDRSWNDYIGRLVQLLQKQMNERQTTMEAYAAAEEAWQHQLQDATSQLAQSTGVSTNASEPIDVDKEEEMVDAAIEEEVAQRQSQEAAAQQYQTLLQTLQAAQQQLVDRPGREGSRTPRRTVTAAQADQDEATAKATQPSPAGLPGVVAREGLKPPPK